MLYCGLDLHAKESFLYVIDHRGRRILVRKVPTQPHCFKEWLGPLVRRRRIADIYQRLANVRKGR